MNYNYKNNLDNTNLSSKFENDLLIINEGNDLNELRKKDLEIIKEQDNLYNYKKIKKIIYRTQKTYYIVTNIINCIKLLTYFI